MDTLYLRFPHITQQKPSPRGFAPRRRPPSPPYSGWTSAAAAAPDESDALHLCNHRQLVPSDYAPLNAVLSAVAHSNTERD